MTFTLPAENLADLHAKRIFGERHQQVLIAAHFLRQGAKVPDLGGYALLRDSVKNRATAADYDDVRRHRKAVQQELMTAVTGDKNPTNLADMLGGLGAGNSTNGGSLAEALSGLGGAKTSKSGNDSQESMNDFMAMAKETGKNAESVKTFALALVADPTWLPEDKAAILKAFLSGNPTA